MAAPGKGILAGVFFVSCTTLCLQISLLRYFSITQSYHFAFLVLSLAFLGYGASGTFLTLIRRLVFSNTDEVLSTASLLFAVGIIACFAASNSTRFDFTRLLWEKAQIFDIALLYFLLSLPFFFAGLAIAAALTRYAAAANKVYFFDLLGAGAGAMLSTAVFLPRGEAAVFPLISIPAFLACFFFSLGRRFWFKALLFLLFLAGVFLLFKAPSRLSFRISPFKALPQALAYPGAKHLLTKWDSVARVDVIESPAVRFAPGMSLLYEGGLPKQTGLTVDGGDISAVTFFETMNDDDLGFLTFLPSSLSYDLVTNPKTLVIDPKGGPDVLAALYFHAARVKVIESLPLVAGLLRKEIAHAGGFHYRHKDVAVVADGSRSALGREKEAFDLIVLPMTDVFGASGTGLYGFGENHLLTMESFIRLLSLLTPQGHVSVTMHRLPPARQELRMLATWIEALEKSGLAAAERVVMLRSWGTLSFFIKKSPFTEPEIRKAEAFARERMFDLVYRPGMQAPEISRALSSAEAEEEKLYFRLFDPELRKIVYQEYLFKIEPPTDNRPFFFGFYRWSRWKDTLQALGGQWFPLLQGGFLIPILFVQAVVTALVLIVLPLFLLRKERHLGKAVSRWRVSFYFSFIGIAFITTEVAFIQKFILFLGQPTLAASSVVSSLLISSGLGSLLSGRILGRSPKKRLRTVLCCAAAIILVYLGILPLLLSRLIGAGLWLKFIFAFFLIFPLGFLMGIPFPTGIRILEPVGNRLVPWAWSANAFFSVIGSVLAAMLAFRGGYNSVLVLAAAGYLLAGLFLDFTRHRDEAHS